MAAKVIDNPFLVLARCGYRDDLTTKMEAYWSSDNYCARMAGRYMQATGRAEPWEVRKSRGYQWIINDQRYKWAGQQAQDDLKSPNKSFVRID